ncbi:MAG: hypothetical protein ACM3SQ_01110 [Betaproteobacteria bacterium]
MRIVILAALAAVLSGAAPGAAQTLPSEPIVLGDGHLTIGGGVSASFAPVDPGYFNDTDYDHSSLRLLRMEVTAALAAGRHVTVLGDLRSENLDAPQPYALYLRVRPWASRAFDIQVGRVPPTFGAFARRTYASDNLLIGYPLAYQYLTSLRPDALPANADELLKMRGRGWLASYSLGASGGDHGVPLVSAFRWDTGVQLHAEGAIFDATGSVTAGTPANPLFREDNSGKQLAGRVAYHPFAGLIVGASAARGAFAADTAARQALGPGASGGDASVQTAWGADVEYSRDYYLVRAEMILSRWTMPRVRQPFIDSPLSALSTSLEGRYRIVPGLYAAARFDHLGFSEITGTAGRATWDAPVTRVEVGGGYSLQRNLVLKISYQYNRRDGGRVRSEHLGATQLVFWF